MNYYNIVANKFVNYSSLISLTKNYFIINNISKKSLKINQNNIKGILFDLTCKSFSKSKKQNKKRNENNLYNVQIWCDDKIDLNPNIKVYCECPDFEFRCQQEIYNLNGLIDNFILKDQLEPKKYDIDQKCEICKHLTVGLFLVDKITHTKNLFKGVKLDEQ